jgi:hypothetical protein
MMELSALEEAAALTAVNRYRPTGGDLPEEYGPRIT